MYPCELPNDLRLRILGYDNILGKLQNPMGTRSSAQPTLRNNNPALAFKISSQLNIKIFWPYQALLDVLIFLRIFCTGLENNRNKLEEQTRTI